MLIAADKPAGVLLVDTGTVTVSVLLIKIVLLAINDAGARVPLIVGHAVFQSSLPTATQVLYSSPNGVELVCVLVGPPRL